MIAFESWRYFLAFLFILARLQSIPNELYEAAKIDGASHSAVSIHNLASDLWNTLCDVPLRFIWTFNKFDDIFLLTGGNAGTRTLTVDVYEQVLLANLGAGSAVAVVIFTLLSLFMIFISDLFHKAEEESNG